MHEIILIPVQAGVLWCGRPEGQLGSVACGPGRCLLSFDHLCERSVNLAAVSKQRFHISAAEFTWCLRSDVCAPAFAINLCSYCLCLLRASEGAAGRVHGAAAKGSHPEEQEEGGPDQDPPAGRRQGQRRSHHLSGLSLWSQCQLASPTAGWGHASASSRPSSVCFAADAQYFQTTDFV